jgi:hypothetical protein
MGTESRKVRKGTWSEQGRDGPTKVARRSPFVSARRSTAETAREGVVYSTRFKHQSDERVRDLLQIRARMTGLRNRWFPATICQQADSHRAGEVITSLDLSQRAARHHCHLFVTHSTEHHSGDGRAYAVDRLSISTRRHADALHDTTTHSTLRRQCLESAARQCIAHHTYRCNDLCDFVYIRIRLPSDSPRPCLGARLH